jgi:hypothetical protein
VQRGAEAIEDKAKQSDGQNKNNDHGARDVALRQIGSSEWRWPGLKNPDRGDDRNARSNAQEQSTPTDQEVG